MKKITIVLHMICLFYYLALTWVNLYPFNDIEAAKQFLGDSFFVQLLIGTMITLIPISVAIMSFRKEKKGFMIISTILITGLLIMQISTNWIPYFVGATSEQMTIHLALFSKTYSILPRIGENPIPDMAHTILMILYLVTLISMFMTILMQKRIEKATMM